jgi:hypothetical protein
MHRRPSLPSGRALRAGQDAGRYGRRSDRRTASRLHRAACTPVRGGRQPPRKSGTAQPEPESGARRGTLGRRSGRQRPPRDGGETPTRVPRAIRNYTSPRWPSARRSDDTEALHGQGARRSDTESHQAGSSHTAKGDCGQPGVGFLDRSKRGTRSMPAWLIVGTRQRRRRSCASDWEETKKGAAVWWRSPKDGNWL